MVKQFLKIAGVKTEAQFYKKYPTEAAFFKAHPEARSFKQMKQGGSILPIFQTDGVVPPFSRGSYGDNEEQWQADMDAYSASLGRGAAPIQGPLQQFIPQGGAQQAAAQIVPAAAQQQAILNPYTGGSLVDLLKTQGKASDKASRKKLAESLGIDNYTGTPDQNKELMQQIRNNPNIIQDMAAGDLMTQKDLDNYTKKQEARRAAARKAAAESKAASERTYSEAEIAAARKLRPDLFEDYNQTQARQNPFVTQRQPVVQQPKKAGATSSVVAPGFKSSGPSKAGKNSNDVKSWWNKTAAQVKAEDPYFFAEENSPGWVKAIDAPFTSMRDMGNKLLLDKDWTQIPKAIAIGTGLGLAGQVFDYLNPMNRPQIQSYKPEILNPKGSSSMPQPNYNAPTLPAPNRLNLPNSSSHLFPEGQALPAGVAPRGLPYRGIVPYRGNGAQAVESPGGMPLLGYAGEEAGAFEAPVNNVQSTSFTPNQVADWMDIVGARNFVMRNPNILSNQLINLPGQIYMNNPDYRKSFGNLGKSQAEGAGYNLADTNRIGTPVKKAYGGMTPDGRALVNSYAQGGGYPYIGLPYHNYDMPMAYAYGGMYQMGGDTEQQSSQTEQIVSAVAEMLQKGAQPKQVEGALVKQGIPAAQARQIVAQVKSRMGASSQQMPMAQDGAYVKGGEYDMDENQIKELERMGYKFDYLD